MQQTYGAVRHTHHDVVRVEDGHILEDFPGHPDELGCDQTADREHSDAPVLWGTTEVRAGEEGRGGDVGTSNG